MLNDHLEMVALLVAESQERQLDEIKKIKARVRGGKIQRNVKVATKPGHKIIDGKEVRMKASERLARKKGQKTGARKRKSGKAGMLRARKKSNRISQRISEERK